MFSKTAHVPIIKEIAKGMEAAGMNGAYLELGIAKGHCFNSIAPHFKIVHAVDINLECYDKVCQVMRKKGSYFHEGTTDDYFEKGNKGQKFNLVFIDANHDFEYVRKDFVNSWNALKDNGIIILHDTYPPNKEYLDHCKDAYKINDFVTWADMVTLPFYFGLTIVRKYKKHLAWMK